MAKMGHFAPFWSGPTSLAHSWHSNESFWHRFLQRANLGWVNDV